MSPLTSIRQLPFSPETWSLQAASTLGGGNGGTANLTASYATAGSSGAASPVYDLRPSAGAVVPATPGTKSANEFSSVLAGLVDEVNAKQGAASQAMEDLQGGGNISLHQAVLAVEEASVSFQLMVEVRNRLLDSYQELMRMQI
jgi:flagellar hook-basal body complex protein FliE